jgi:hypothetical protein
MNETNKTVAAVNSIVNVVSTAALGAAASSAGSASSVIGASVAMMPPWRVADAKASLMRRLPRNLGAKYREAA